MPFSPNYSLPYQTLADAPHGPDLGEGLALATDTALTAMDLRVDATETALTLRAAIGIRTTTQSIANATETDITLPTQEKDTTAMFTPGDAHITIPAGGSGLYLCVAWAVWAVGGTGFRRIGISKNNGVTAGTDIWYVVTTNTGGSADVGQVMSVMLDLTAGDNIRIKGLHNQGSALNIDRARLHVARWPA